MASTPMLQPLAVLAARTTLRPGDVVMVWKFDRLSRSLKDLLNILEKIDAAKAGFRRLTEPVNTTRAGSLRATLHDSAWHPEHLTAGRDNRPQLRDLRTAHRRPGLLAHEPPL